MRLTNETPLFPLRKGVIARQAHVDLPPGTFEEEFARQGFYGRTTHGATRSLPGPGSKARCARTAMT